MTTAKSEQLVSRYYQVLDSRSPNFDRVGLRSLLASDLDFDGPIAGHVRGADRFISGAAGFIERQRGMTILQQVITPTSAAVIYDAELPGGTVRFAEFFQIDEVITAIRLLYDVNKYLAAGGG